jgi:hypothetical protein
MARSVFRRCVWLLVLLLGLVTCAARDADPYRLLDVGRGAAESEIKKSYRKLSLKYHPDKQQGKTADEVEKAANRFMTIQKAYETLSDPEKKRNYDTTGFADPRDAYKASPGGRGSGPQRRNPGSRGGWDSDTGGFPGAGAGGRFGGFGFPQADPITSETQELTPKNFEKLVLSSNRAWLVQVYHDASEKCQRAAPIWDQTARTLDGSAKLGRVNMATYPDLAAKVAPQNRFSSSAVSPKDLPAVIGFHKECSSFSCRRRYRGLMKETALSKYVLDRMLKYKEIPEFTRDTLPGFLESEPTKVKFVVFVSRSSSTQPLLRRAASEYERDVLFAVVHHKRGDASYWMKKFGVRAHSAVMVIKEDGKKIVEHEVTGKNKLRELLVEHKLPILPRLHAASLKSTGCQPGGLVQVCVVVLGVQGWALEDAKKVLRDAKLSLDSSTASPNNPLVAALGENKELAFAWVDAASQGAFCKALLYDNRDDAASCGRSTMEPRIAVMRFRDGPNSMEYGGYEGAMSLKEILSWVGGVFGGKGQRLIMVDRDAPNYPDLKAHASGAMEYLKRIKTTLWFSAYDLGEEFMYALAESGPILPFFIALLAMFASTFFPSKSKAKPRRNAAKRNPADDDVVLEYNDETLASLKTARSEMVVMMFVDGKTTSQTVFKRVRASFWREPVLSFGTVNIARPGAWAQFAQTLGALPGTVIVWHALRKKFKRIGAGDGSVPHPVICSKIETILDGDVDWDSGDWPSEQAPARPPSDGLTN